MSYPLQPCRQIGDYLVQALSDGNMAVSLDLLSGIETAEAQRLQSDAKTTAPGTLDINSYLIRGHGRHILVDAGTGGLNNAGGMLIASLDAVGVKPADIDMLLLTHGHPDHIGGLLDSQGEPVFPRAELYLHRREAEHWLNDQRFNAASERGQRNFALMRRTLTAYASRVHFIDNEEEIVTGILPVWLPGHTPGHTGFAIHSAGESLLIWGDIVHFPAIQSVQPAAAILFDWDPVQAAETRRKILHQAAEQSLLIAGMHLERAGFARITVADKGYHLVYLNDS